MNAHLKLHEDQQLILTAWKQAIELGNQAFSCRNTQKARINYQTALRVALAMMKSADDWGVGIPVMQADAIMAAFVVTQHNLADLYAHAGLLGRAAEHLCEAQEVVFGLLNHPIDEIVELAHRHLFMTRMELLSFLQKYGDYPRISQALCATQLPSPLFSATH